MSQGAPREQRSKSKVNRSKIISSQPYRSPQCSSSFRSPSHPTLTSILDSQYSQRPKIKVRTLSSRQISSILLLFPCSLSSHSWSTSVSGTTTAMSHLHLYCFPFFPFSLLQNWSCKFGLQKEHLFSLIVVKRIHVCFEHTIFSSSIHLVRWSSRMRFINYDKVFLSLTFPSCLHRRTPAGRDGRACRSARSSRVRRIRPTEIRDQRSDYEDQNSDYKDHIAIHYQRLTHIPGG